MGAFPIDFIPRWFYPIYPPDLWSVIKISGGHVSGNWCDPSDLKESFFRYCTAQVTLLPNFQIYNIKNDGNKCGKCFINEKYQISTQSQIKVHLQEIKRNDNNNHMIWSRRL